MVIEITSPATAAATLSASMKTWFANLGAATKTRLTALPAFPTRLIALLGTATPQMRADLRTRFAAVKPTRMLQLLWVAAGAMVTMVLIHSSRMADFGTPNSEWMALSQKTQAILWAGGGKAAPVALHVHVQLAEAAWARSVQARHDLIRADYGVVDDMEFYPATSPETYARHPYAIWDFVPATWPCPHEMERLGRLGPGGKWICGLNAIARASAIPDNDDNGKRTIQPDHPCVVYSLGVDVSSSFENDLLSRTSCELWAYDAAASAGVVTGLDPAVVERARFIRAKVGSVANETLDPPMYRISDLMRINGHTYIDVLKMDINSDEFAALDDLSGDFSADDGLEFPVGQLILDIHLEIGSGEPGPDRTPVKFLKWWERLEARGLRPTWMELNLPAITMRSPADRVPLLATYTFLNVRDSRSVIFGGVAVAAAAASG